MRFLSVLDHLKKVKSYLLIGALFLVQTLSLVIIHFTLVKQQNQMATVILNINSQLEILTQQIENQKKVLAHQDNLLNLVELKKNSTPSGLYNQFLEVLTSKPVLIVGGIVIAGIAIYVGLNYIKGSGGNSANNFNGDSKNNQNSNAGDNLINFKDASVGDNDVNLAKLDTAHAENINEIAEVISKNLEDLRSHVEKCEILSGDVREVVGKLDLLSTNLEIHSSELEKHITDIPGLTEILTGDAHSIIKNLEYVGTIEKPLIKNLEDLSSTVEELSVDLVYKLNSVVYNLNDLSTNASNSSNKLLYASFDMEIACESGGESLSFPEMLLQHFTKLEDCGSLTCYDGINALNMVIQKAAGIDPLLAEKLGEIVTKCVS